MQLGLCTAYFAVLLLLSMYGIHRSHLVLTCLRYRERLKQMRHGLPPLLSTPSAGVPPPSIGVPPPANPDGNEPATEPPPVPRVTMQLPIFNEATVIARLLDHVAAVRYPRSALEIQVLDDSTDETEVLARAHVAELRRTHPD